MVKHDHPIRKTEHRVGVPACTDAVQSSTGLSKRLCGPENDSNVRSYIAVDQGAIAAGHNDEHCIRKRRTPFLLCYQKAAWTRKGRGRTGWRVRQLHRTVP